MARLKQGFQYEVTNATQQDAELKIYGYIGKWEAVDYAGFQQAFRDLITSKTTLTVRLHCGGGSVYEGLAIYDLMRSSDCKITTINEGLAASMGSIILLGGDIIKTTKNAFFMAHDVEMGVYGNRQKVQSGLEQMEGCVARIKKIYKERTNASEEVIEGWVKPGQETWLDSDKCANLGIVDEVIEPVKKRAVDPEDMSNRTAEDIFKLFEGPASKESGPSNDTNQTSAMKKEAIMAILMAAGLAGELTASSADGDFANQLQALADKAVNSDKYKQEVDRMTNELMKATLDPAQQAGKFKPTERAEWEADFKANPNMVIRTLSRIPGKPDLNGMTQRERQALGNEGDHELMKGRGDWSFEKWQETDPKGLARLQDEAPEAFEKLFNAKFNH